MKHKDPASVTTSAAADTKLTPAATNVKGQNDSAIKAVEKNATKKHVEVEDVEFVCAGHQHEWHLAQR